MPRISTFRCIVCLWCWAAAAPGQSGEPVDYQKHIKPLLRDRCYTCHGALTQQAGLRLDTVGLMEKGGDTGPAIVRGDAAGSHLIRRVTASDAAERMPPEHDGQPLTADQVQLLRDWIAAGALGPKDEQPEPDPRAHWAFRPVSRPRLPVVADAAWPRGPIDSFLMAAYEQRQVGPQVAASRAILLRRLYLDLVGLPPAVDELQAFEADESPDAYERTVDRLLADPRHGQRWARHWMDIWRYSDWWGLGDQLRSSQKHIWHWRDWIVESLDADLPYDEMVRLMLAADEIAPNDFDRLRASGFLARNYFLFNRNQWMDEVVEHVNKAFLGLTMNCTKCHDHKYDPIRQVDFYRMRAFFEPYHVRMDVLPGEADLGRDGLPRAFDGLPDVPTYRYERGQESRPDKSVVIAPGVPELLAFRRLVIEPVSLPAEAWQPERRPWVAAAQLAAARQGVVSADAALANARTKRENARKQESAAAPNPPPDAVRAAVADAEAEVKVAESARAVAEAAARSVEYRVAAMRAIWARADAADGDGALADVERQKMVEAVKAERQVAVAKASQAVAAVELKLLRAAADKKEATEKERNAAREACDKAIAAAATEVLPTDRCAPLVGAQWTPTRFLSSTADDPTVPFVRQSTGRRKALAEWITDSRNPLTARVAVNHLWLRHIGSPLVATVFDFGRKGSPPTHPELLDWLAAEFLAVGWDLKHMHRQIVTSAAYRLSSSAEGRAANLTQDPDNRLLWRRTPQRLESQAVRDSILALAGTLDLTRGGPPVPADQQAQSQRRSLYFFHSNNDRNLFLMTFDEAAVKECYRRDQSIVPQQALALTNSQLVQDAASRIAGRVTAEAARGVAADDEAEFVRQAFRAVLGVGPSDAELVACRQALRRWRELPGGTDEAARAGLVWALLNHNDFVTIR